MDERRDNEGELVGGLGAEAHSVPSEVDMPMLAGSAAVRLTKQILARLASPHAMHSTSPVRPAALWRQVARRLGILPEEGSRPGLGRSAARSQEQSRSTQDPLGPPPPQFVWRTVSSPRQAHEEHISVEEMLASALRPATTTRTAQPSAPSPIASSSPQVQPSTQAQPTPVQAVSAPSSLMPPASTPAATQLSEAYSLGREPSSLMPPTSTPAASQAPAAVSQPPGVPAPIVAPAKVVVVEYVPGPAALPLQPLASHTPLVEPSPPVPKNLADSLNRDLVPTTDMISRRVPASWEEIPLREARQSVPGATQATEPVQPSVAPVAQAPALPVVEAASLEMPLAATPTTPTTTPRIPARPVTEAVEHAERGPVRQLIDRVATALPLPDAVRRFITGNNPEKQPTPSGVEPGAMAPSVSTATQQAQAQAAPSPSQPRVLAQPTGTAPVAVPTTSTAPVAVPTTSTAPVAVPATSAAPVAVPTTGAISSQAPTPTPVEVAQSERASRETVSAPAPVSAPSTIEMPVRASASAVTKGGQQAQGVQPAQVQPRPQATQPAPAALGPFQPFQAIQPVQVGQQAQQPQGQQAQIDQAQPESQIAPLGPFEPFQPTQPVVAGQSPLVFQPAPTPVQLPQPAIPVAPFGADEEPPVATSPVQPLQSAGHVAPTPPARSLEASPLVPTVSQPVQEPALAQAEAIGQVAAGEETQVVTPPAMAPETVQKTPVRDEREPRGFLGALLDRLFGRGERTAPDEQQQEFEQTREESRTPAIQMPWVRRGRSPQVSSTESRGPGEVELPGTRIAQTERQASPGGSASPSAPTPATDSTPSIASASASEASVTSVQAQPAQPIAGTSAQMGEFVEPAVSPLPTPPGTQVVPEQGSQAGHSDTEAVSSQVPRALVEAPTPSGPPPALDMPHAAQQTTQSASNENEVMDLMQRATLPVESVATPTNTAQAEVPAIRATAQPEPEPSQAWTLMPQVADALVRSHAPLSSVEPMETAAQSELLARILGGLGHEIGTYAPTDALRAVPVPATGVGMELPFTQASGQGQSTGMNVAGAEAVSARNIQAVELPPVQVATGGALQAGPTSPAPRLPNLMPTPMVSPPQLVPGSLRDIRTSANLPVASESIERAVSGGTAGVPELPMPPRYITNVTPASYLAEAAMSSVQTGIVGDTRLPSAGTMTRPASHISPSIGNYGRPDGGESAARATIMLPLSEMSPTADSFAQSEARPDGQGQPQQQHEQEQEQEQQPPWMAALQALYGPKGNDDMPLAIPFGAFALPSEPEPTPATSTWLAPAFGQPDVDSSPGREASEGFSALRMPTPSVPNLHSSVGRQSPSQPSSFPGSYPSGWSTDSWSAGKERGYAAPGYSSWSTDGYSEGDSEVSAWANVVASAVSGASQSAPALALAGEERSAATSQEPPANAQEGGQAAEPDLDELASSVLDIIRNKLLIERERNFG